MKFFRLIHLIVSFLLFVTYIGGTFISCSPHHAYAGEEQTAKIESDHTHSHSHASSSHSENNEEQDDHCREGNLGGIYIYVHKDSFHNLTQVSLLSMMSVPFFMVQEKNHAYFYGEQAGIYKQQLYDSEVTYANERKNIIEVLI